MSSNTDVESSSTVQSDTRVKKEVMLTAYARAAETSAREFIGAIVEDEITLDPFEKREREDRNSSLSFEIEIPHTTKDYQDTLTIEASTSVFGSDADAVVDAITSGELDLDDSMLEWTDETSKSIEHSYSTTKLLKSYIKEIFSDFESPVESYQDAESFATLQFEKTGPAVPEDDAMYAELQGPYNSHIGSQKVLKLQPDRSADDRFEIDEDDEPVERQAIQFQFEVEGTNSAEVDQMTEAFISTVRDAIKGKSAVGRIRLTDCEKTVTETGDCHNI